MSNHPMLTIREAEVTEAPLIADMSRRTFYDTFAASNKTTDMDKFMDEQFSFQKLVEEVGAPGNLFLLAFTGREAQGYARLRFNNNPPSLGNNKAMEIARLYVEKTAIGTGVGHCLMEQCIERAKQAGCDQVWLGVWEHNQRAIRFYEKNGFVKFAEHPFVLGDDVQTDWLMKKQLH